MSPKSFVLAIIVAVYTANTNAVPQFPVGGVFVLGGQPMQPAASSTTAAKPSPTVVKMPPMEATALKTAAPMAPPTVQTSHQVDDYMQKEMTFPSKLGRCAVSFPVNKGQYRHPDNREYHADTFSKTVFSICLGRLLRWGVLCTAEIASVIHQGSTSSTDFEIAPLSPVIGPRAKA